MKFAIVTTALMILLAVPAVAQLDGEYGDAPEGVLAYPPPVNVMGSFPTCVQVGPAPWIYHGPLCWAHFPGMMPPPFDFEIDGNAGLCPNFNPYDLDECWGGPDAGLLFPPAYTIVAGVVQPCQPGAVGSLGVSCTNAFWGGNVDIMVVNNMPVDGFVNVLIDWDQSGNWAGSSQCPGGAAPEHVLVDFPVPMGFAGPLSALGPPPFLVGPLNGYFWSRFSITEQPVGSNWDGSGIFEDGETEDYLLLVDDWFASEETSWGSVKSLYR